MLTKQQCDFIVERNNSFYRSDHVVNGRNVVTYNYRQAMPGDFANPTKAVSQSHVLNGHWMRGITFVEYVDSKGVVDWQVWPMLPKFFNVNQSETSAIHKLKELGIQLVLPKYDGSLIGFVKIDGSWLAKTQNSFDNEQTELIKSAGLMNDELIGVLENSLENGYAVVYELTSPLNRVVVNYDETELKPLFMIHIDSGALVPITREFNWFSFEELIESQKTLTDTEGYVVLFANGQLVKFKTEWYFEKHHLRFNSLTPMNVLHLMLNGTADDLVSALDTQEEIDLVNSWLTVFSSKFNDLVEKSYSEFKRINESTGGVRRWFYSEAKQTEVTDYLMTLYEIPGADIAAAVKRNWLKKLTRESRVKEFFKL